MGEDQDLGNIPIMDFVVWSGFSFFCGIQENQGGTPKSRSDE